MEPVKKEHLIGLLERLFNNPLIANPAKLPDNISLDKPANENEFIQLGKKYNKLAKEIEFYKLSSDIWAFLEKEINNMFWRWFNQVRTNLSDPLGFTPNLARYYWKLIPPFGWDGQQFRKSVQLAKYCTNVQQKILTDQEIGEKDLKKEIRKIERIVRGWHNKVDIYYNAACYYAQLSVLANKQKQKYITDALKYLKIAFKHQKDLEIVWVQNDPDLKPLKNDPEYQALFVCPNKMEFSNESLDEVDRKGKLYVFELLQKGAGQQIKDWVNLSNNQHSFAVLIIEAEYQIRLWESLIKLLKLPTVQLQQELFWQVAMQKAPNRDIPVHKKDNHKISLKVIDPAWENITNHAQPQIDAWKLRLKDSKLFLNQPVSLKPSEILEMWNQSETWLWEYILQQINKLV